MKKIFKLAMAFVLCFPFVAKADMAIGDVPQLGYEAIVTAEGGATFCDYENDCVTIKKGESFEITDMYYFDGDPNDVGYSIKYNGKEYDAYNAKDNNSFVPAKDSVAIEDYFDSDTAKKEYVIYTTEEVEIRKGPNKKFGVVGTIPKGTYLQTFQVVGDYTPVRYNGMSGWVTGAAELYIDSEYEFYDYVATEDIATCNVPKGTFIRYIGILQGTLEEEYETVLGYKDCIFTVKDVKNSVMYVDDSSIEEAKAKKDIALYDLKGNQTATIKSGDTFYFVFRNEESNYGKAQNVYYNGTYGSIYKDTIIKDYTLGKRVKLEAINATKGEFKFADEAKNPKNIIDKNDKEYGKNNTSSDSLPSEETCKWWIIGGIAGITTVLIVLVISILVKKDKKKKFNNLDTKKEE